MSIKIKVCLIILQPKLSDEEFTMSWCCFEIIKLAPTENSVSAKKMVGTKYYKNKFRPMQILMSESKLVEI